MMYTRKCIPRSSGRIGLFELNCKFHCHALLYKDLSDVTTKSTLNKDTPTTSSASKSDNAKDSFLRRSDSFMQRALLMQKQKQKEKTKETEKEKEKQRPTRSQYKSNAENESAQNLSRTRIARRKSRTDRTIKASRRRSNASKEKELRGHQSNDVTKNVSNSENRKGGELTHYITSTKNSNKPILQCIAPKKGEVPLLAHNLDRVLFSPGVHFLQDPRTRIYNFTPFLKNVINYRDFNFDAVSSYTPVSKHKVMLMNAQKFKKQFYSSTSSMTSLLSKFYMFLNNYSRHRVNRFGNIPFSGMINDLPSIIFAQPQGEFQDEQGNSKTVYSLQEDSSCDAEILLSAMGVCMETLLTNPEKEFLKYKKEKGHKVLSLNGEQQSPQPLHSLTPLPPSPPVNSYNYASVGSFLMRSQLDCYDPRLPGNGTFDLKTRASANVRYNSRDPNAGEGDYQIFKLRGDFESYEAEFRDLIRTGAMLKYLFQARIGQMDGIFIAYHNVNSIFGFQYLPLEELDKLFYCEKFNEKQLKADLETVAIEEHHGQENLPSFIGETQFKFSMEMWEKLMTNHILKDFAEAGLKDTPFRMLVETVQPRGTKNKFLRVIAIPVTVDEIKEFQLFPKKHPTDFKQDLTDEQRQTNLQKHSKELKVYNEQTTRDRKILQYTIDLHLSFVNGESSPYYILPKVMTKDWKLSYTITKVDFDAKTNLKRMLSQAVDKLLLKSGQTLTSLQKIHKFYEKLGTLRKENWALKEEVPQVYKPVFKDDDA